MLFAEINIKNQIHKIYDVEKKPVFAPYIKIIDVTNMNPSPQEGWFLLEDGTFSPTKAESLPAPTIEDRLEAIEQTSAYTQIQVEYLATLAEINNGL